MTIWSIIQAINQSFQKLQTFNCKVRFATISQVSLTSYIDFQHKKGNLLKSIHQFEQITYQQNPLRMISFKIMKKFVKLVQAPFVWTKMSQNFYKTTGQKWGQS